MAAVNQDFVTYQGDSPKPIFFVQNNGVAIDISGATEITWTVQRNAQDTTPILKKTKSGGQIVFVTNGTDGKFQVTIASGDTQALSGWYQHIAAVTDASGNIATVTVGRMQVGITPTWTYDDGTAASQDIYLIRDMIGDTIQSDQLLSDQTIFNSLNRYSAVELAAAECCRFIASKYARQVDVVQGELKTNYSNIRKAYMTQAQDLETRGMARGGASAYVGGISLSDKDNNVQNPDRTPPQFVIGMFDNLLPESPVGHQTGAGQALPDDQSIPGVFSG